MLDNLDLLVIVFIAMAVLSILGLAIQFLVKNEKIQKVSFYFASVLGALLAVFKVMSTPLYSGYGGQVIIGLVLGALAIAAVVLQLVKKDEKSFKLARILTTISGSPSPDLLTDTSLKNARLLLTLR